MKQKIDLDLVSQLVSQEKRYSIRDTDIDGFLIRVYPSGKLGFYLDYYSPVGANRGKRVNHNLASSDLSMFQGDRALVAKMQAVAVTQFRKQAKTARGLVDAGLDPQEGVRERRSERKVESQERKQRLLDKQA